MKFLIIFFLVTLPLLGVAPNLIPVQGVLTENDGAPINGNVSLTLSLYDSQTATDELWREEREDFAVEDGYISLYLGEKTELSPSVISNASQLWLEIIFNNERVPRVRLASVPYALEAINVQKAKQIGDITEDQISNMFNSTCDDNYYIQGYDNDGNPICIEDKVETNNDNNVTYNAGNGINIDENNNISVVDNLYIGENGVNIENNIISVDYSKVSSSSHNHDAIYYKKSDNAKNNHLVKYSGDEITNSSILEIDGEVTMENLTISNNGIFPKLDVDNLKVDEIKGDSNNKLNVNATFLTINGDIVSNNDTTLDGEITVDGKLISYGIIPSQKLTIPGIKFSNEQIISMFNVLDASSRPDADEDETNDKYISDDGTLTANYSDGTTLTKDNSVCSIKNNQIEFNQFSDDLSKCEVYLSGKYWKIKVYNDYHVTIKCRARCFKWN